MTKLTEIEMTVAEALKEIEAIASLGEPVGIVGPPGIGKTAIPVTLSERLGLPYHEIRAAELEPYDFRGGMYLNAKTKRTEWFPAEFWPEEKCVLNFDELTQASLDVTSPLLKVFLGREIGKTKLHPETVLTYTGNRIEDRAGCSRLSSALRERCITINLKADLACFLSWYEAQPEYNEAVAEYLTQNPKAIHNWDAREDFNQPTPRNWFKVGRVAKLTQNPTLLAGIIGPNVAAGFTKFLRSHFTIPQVANVLSGLSEAPTDTIAMEAWSVRLADAAFATLDQDEVVGLVRAMPKSFRVMTIKTIAQRDRKKLGTKAWKALVADHAEAILAASTS